MACYEEFARDRGDAKIKTKKKKSIEEDILEVFYRQKTFWMSFIGRSPFGGLLWSDDLLQVLFRLISIRTSPLDIITSGGLAETGLLYSEDPCRSSICRRPYGGLL